jgi:hypothetical protein
MDTQWIPLMDYSMKTGVSLSTLRRHIKAGKIEFRRHEGRYLLKDDASAPRKESFSRGQTVFAQTSTDAAPGGAPKNTAAQESRSADDLSALRLQLRHAQEEIAELKTLLACYEERES